MTPTPALRARLAVALVAALALAPVAAHAAKKAVKRAPKTEAAAPAEETKPADAPKADEKEPEAAKAAEEKPADAKPADAKPEEKKADAKPADAKPEEKKADAKPADAKPEEKKADAKPEEKKAETPAKPAEPAERTIEKGDEFLTARLTFKPGLLKPNRIAEVFLELSKLRDEPDPIDGDRAPVLADVALLVVTPPASAPDKKAKKKPAAAAPADLEYVLHPAGQPGAYAAHFTPAVDGVYLVKVVAGEKVEEGQPIKLRDVTFRIGVGKDHAETELGQAQGKARRTSGRRRVIGSTATKVDDRLQRAMAEIGEQFLELETTFAAAPPKGAFPAGAAGLRTLAAKFAEVKSLAPATHAGAAGEFDTLAAKMVERLEAAAVAAEKPKDPKAAANAKAAFDQVAAQGCLQCHTKFRYGVTDDVSRWPEFEARAWK